MELAFPAEVKIHSFFERSERDVIERILRRYGLRVGADRHAASECAPQGRSVGDPGEPREL